MPQVPVERIVEKKVNVPYEQVVEKIVNVPVEILVNKVVEKVLTPFTPCLAALSLQPALKVLCVDLF